MNRDMVTEAAELTARLFDIADWLEGQRNIMLNSFGNDVRMAAKARTQSPDPAEEALRNIIASSEANDGDSLMNAIEDAKALLRTKAFGWGRITTAALSAPKEGK